MADLSQVEAARKEGYSDADIAAHLAKMDQRIKEALDSGYEPKDIFARLSKPVSVEEPKTYSDRSTIVPIASMIAQAPGAVSDLGVMGTLNAMRSIPGDIVGGAFDSLQRAGGNFRENEKKMGTPAAAMMVPADFLLGSAPSNIRKDVGEGNWSAVAGDVESIASQAGMMAAATNPRAKGGPTLGAIARSPVRAADAALEAVGGAKKLGLEYARDIVNTGHGGLIATPVKMAARRILKKMGEGERDLSAFEKLAMQDTKRAQAAEFNLAKSISQAEDAVAKQAQRDSMSSAKAETRILERAKNLKGIMKNGNAAPEAPNTLLTISREYARGENPAGLPAAAEAPRSLPRPSRAIEKADPSLPLAERAEINLQRGKEATSAREARSQEIGAKTDATGWADTGALMDELKQMFKGKTFNRAAYDALPEKYKKINYNMARVLVEQAK